MDSAASVSDPLADDKKCLAADCVFVLKTWKFGGGFLMCCCFVLMAEQKAFDGINVQLS